MFYRTFLQKHDKNYFKRFLYFQRLAIYKYFNSIFIIFPILLNIGEWCRKLQGKKYKLLLNGRDMREIHLL